MMAVHVKRLNEGEHCHVVDDGKVIGVERAWVKSDRTMAARRMDQDLLAHAAIGVEGVRRWYALRSGNRGEIELAKALTDSRIDAVVPVKQVPVKRRFNASSSKVVHRPVLSGLVFVNVVPSIEAFAGMMRVKGVAAIIGSDGRPAAIGDREMNGFMDLAQAGAFDERNTPTGLKVGSRVRINVGIYAQMEGVLEGYAKGRAARVMTFLFGRGMVVDVPLAHIEISD